MASTVSSSPAISDDDFFLCWSSLGLHLPPCLLPSSLLHPTPGVEFSRKVRSLLGSDPQSCPLPLTMLEVFVLLHPSLVLNSMAHFQLVHTAPMAHCAYLAMWCKVDRTCWVSCFSCAGLFHEFSKCIYICLFNDVWILNLTCLRDMHIWYQTM